MPISVLHVQGFGYAHHWLCLVIGAALSGREQTTDTACRSGPFRAHHRPAAKLEWLPVHCLGRRRRIHRFQERTPCVSHATFLVKMSTM